MKSVPFWTGVLFMSLGGFCMGVSAHDALKPLLFVSLPCFVIGYLLIQQDRPRIRSYGVTRSIPITPQKRTQSHPVLAGASMAHEELIQLEKKIDAVLLHYLHLLKRMFPGYTYGIFLSTGLGQWSLRAHLSASSYIFPKASITMGGGLLGLLYKKEITRILEIDIVTDATQLGLYTQDEKIRSLVSVPIEAKGQRRGAVLIDSQNPNAFEESDVVQLQEFAKILEEYLYRAYVSVEYRYQRDKLSKKLQSQNVASSEVPESI
jgi:putative methionine-R-sulfoxide reductase with GAF domain